MKKHLIRFIFGSLCVLVMLGHAATKQGVFPFISLLDAHIYDSKVRWFMPDTVDERVVIVDIDEKSLAVLGRWPWNRKLLSDLVIRVVDEHQAKEFGVVRS